MAVKQWLMVYRDLSIEEDSKIMGNGFASYKEMLDGYLNLLETTRKRLFPKALPREWEGV